MSVIEKIQRAAPELTQSERRLVQSLMDSPRQAALARASDLAREVGVHEATASRLARKLGYESYATFRRALQDAFLPKEEPATRIERTISERESGDPLEFLIEQEMAALAALPRYPGTAQIEAMAREALAARRMLVFAQGNADVLASLMVRRFRRFGQVAEALSPDPRTLAEQALGFRAGDVVLAFAFRRPPRGYQPLVEAAHEAGARVLAITDTIGPLLTPAPDRLIAVARGGSPDGFQSLVVPMTVCNAIVLAAAAAERETTLRRLDRLGELIRRFE